MRRDNLHLQKIKLKQIREIKKINKEEMFQVKKKQTFFEKILHILGYGKKG